MPSTIIPGMRYQDAPAAIEFLCDAFGFDKRLVVPGEDGAIAHAQLTLGDGMIMIGSVRDDAHGKHMKLPSQAGGITQSAYIVVAAIEAHYEKAKAAGAEILHELEKQEYGGAVYTARDPQGQIWNFGSYDPWADPE